MIFCIKRKKCQVTRGKELFYYVTSGSNGMRDVHWCETVFYQQIENGKIANQIHGFTIDYGKFILTRHSRHVFGTRLHEGLLKHIPRLRFWCVIITTLYQLMLQSWYRKPAQSLVNTLVLFWQGEIFSYYGILISRMKCNFWQSLNKFCTWGSELP